MEHRRGRGTGRASGRDRPAQRVSGADGDTGTNLALTLRAACDALAADAAPTAAAALRTLARGAVLGARGNSGVIVSQILRGFADAIGGDSCDGPGLQAALRQAADHAYAAVAEPLEARS